MGIFYFILNRWSYKENQSNGIHNENKNWIYYYAEMEGSISSLLDHISLETIITLNF